MNQSLVDLVSEISALTGAALPGLAQADAPVLDQAQLQPVADFYLVGMIGGKDVGKSALINAIAEHPITESTGWGEGTQQVIAYVHRSQRDAVGRLLADLAPGKHRIVEHTIASLQRQVLMDLPDIDSHYQQHVHLTRRMLRHMLFPIWVQSVEKYADRQMQDLLGQVAQGNDPANFIFCLNKVDQLPGMIQAGGATARTAARAADPQAMAELSELKDDYARRLADVLKLPEKPGVFAVSAMLADRFDMPRLRQRVGSQRTAADVASARTIAARRQADVVLDWVQAQDLPAQLARTLRLQTQAQQMLQGRLLPMVMDRVVVPRSQSMAGRLEMIDLCMGQRVKHWPIVSGVHAMLWPVLALIRRNVEPEGTDANGRPSVQLVDELTAAVQGTFATLQQTQPAVSELYARQKLWEPQVAQQAVGGLISQVDQASGVQRQAVIDRMGRPTTLLWPLRWLLTIGAILWFPLVQPMVSAYLGNEPGSVPSWMDVIRAVVSHLSVSFLLENVAFLVGWHLLLWMMLRWDVQRKVDRYQQQVTRGTMDRPGADPQTAAMDWMDDLLVPLQTRGEKLQQVIDRVKSVQDAHAK